MRMIISPAKKMREDPDSFAPEGLPPFLPEAERLKQQLQAMSYDQLKALWRCSDAIAQQNVERLEGMDLNKRLTPALLAYEGIQYRYMAPGVFEREQLDYIREHLRILSGFYGLLRPFDGVVPYRLEMQAPLAVDDCRDLYAFWGDKLAKALAEETDTVLNLASREYSRAVEPHLPASASFVTCTFGELQGGKVVEKGTLCKMARGEMVRWMAVHQIERTGDLTAFQALGYRFSPAHSNQTHLVFLKGEF
ncbi:peroxide stress protein YaaA [Pseudoflavonifractor sp. AF19-9AC]|uniref:peroxide stress protein YaaA n=1 Tax=Pseudoflavonifractor sp. AF19-9AC TaxID=2292244 RepID=UPI000E4DFB08|nr:peroxide stress protein YaaA [Pseudoflavonifractor sp. AF19-9AC]RHR11244.1 peroxide stress protein YaaA [Pseudoflavonifractor sp. AF19-9AC]